MSNHRYVGSIPITRSKPTEQSSQHGWPVENVFCWHLPDTADFDCHRRSVLRRESYSRKQSLVSSLLLGKPLYSVESRGCSGATDVRDLNGGSVARDEIDRGLPDCIGQTVDIFEPVRASLFRQKANHDIRAGELDSAN